MYEGTPDFPDKDRWWAIVERYGVTILYTAPTAIRAHMKWGAEYAERHELGSLRLLGTVGEPINPEAWMWYRAEHRRRPLPDRRHVVADRDGDDADHAAPRGDDDEAGLGDEAVPRHRCGDLRRERARGAGRAAAGTSCCGGRGRRCSAGSGATTSGTARRTGRGSRACTSRGTARGPTATATSGCSGAWTT